MCKANFFINHADIYLYRYRNDNNPFADCVENILYLANQLEKSCKGFSTKSGTQVHCCCHTNMAAKLGKLSNEAPIYRMLKESIENKKFHFHHTMHSAVHANIFEKIYNELYKTYFDMVFQEGILYQDPAPTHIRIGDWSHS